MPDKLSAPFLIERSFAAPRELVYAALTEAGPLSQWMCPVGMEMTQCDVDSRVGGVFHYGMKLLGMPNMPTMWGKWTFRELQAPERVVVVVQFSDAQGGLTRHPMAPQWPLLTLSTTTLSEVAGGTLMRLEWRALNANEIEEALFNASHASMTQGWSGTMANLEQYLKRRLADDDIVHPKA